MIPLEHETLEEYRLRYMEQMKDVYPNEQQRLAACAKSWMYWQEKHD